MNHMDFSDLMDLCLMDHIMALMDFQDLIILSLEENMIIELTK
jgi:hypothetical protein